MRIFIGPYKGHLNGYSLSNLLRYIGVNEKRRDSIGSWLCDSYIQKLFDKINDFNVRKIKIKIDKYDTWSMDHTLALIILPMLKQLKQTKNGAPFVDDSDVPEGIRSTNAIDDKDDLDKYHFIRWDYVLNEIVWAFEQIVNDDGDDIFFTGTVDIEFPESSEEYPPVIFKKSPDYHFDKDAYTKHHERINNGLWLFGKYYRGLWD